jgi:hypothetical protein
MAFYMFLQMEEKSKWIPALATERENIAKTRKPALVSVLDVDNSFDTDLSLDEIRGLRYSGPLYFDFDAEDIEEACTQFKVFLNNLKAKDVDLDMVRLYATGKKGFHIEVPPQLFMGKMPPSGVLHLPHIYNEIAHALFVDCIDMRVYSSRRGRMWRCPNVKRADNGKYKVQISAEEALTITPDLYAEICSTPRNPLPVEPPTLNSDLALLYAQSSDKVNKGVAKKKARKTTSNPLQKFGGEWPDTFEGILQGVTLKADVGWNYISMQLAIVASELGKTEDQLLNDAEGVICNHESDSTRYNTPTKRRQDLRDMFRYVNGNPCYEYSVGAIMSLLLPEVRANADISFGDYVPDEEDEDGNEAGESIGQGSEGDRPRGKALEGPLRIIKSGIFARVDDGWRNICDLGLMNPLAMSRLDGDRLGYEVDVTLDGVAVGKRFIPMNALATRSQFNNWALLLGASMRGTDQQVSSLADMLRKGTSSTTATVYAVEREGIDVVTPFGAGSSSQEDVIWASPDAVVCLRPGVSYRYHGVYSPIGTYHSDLMLAPELTREDESYVRDLLSINTSQNIAKMLGWFCAAFLTQLIRKKFKRFPSLQVYGQAGAGKSMTVILLNHLHYHLVEPRQFSVAGQTQFPIIAAVATSASQPVIFEEVKRRQINKNMLDFLQNILRSNYTADHLSRGSLGRDKSVRELTVTDFNNAAPVAFVGEAVEDQSAILERCVCVALSKTDRAGRNKYFERCLDKVHRMGRIGKLLAMGALAIDREWLHAQLNANFKAVTGKLSAAMADDATRPAFNLAVTLTGLDFLKGNLARVFGDTFDARLDELRESILSNVMDSIPINMSEVSRVLDTMARLTRNEDDQFRLVPGVDYVVKDNSLELKLRNAFDKYVRYQRSLGLEVLFDSHNAWQSAMINYGGTMQRAVPESVMWDSPKAVIFRLSLSYMDAEGIDAFK